MNLKSYNWKPLLTTSNADLIQEFFNPALTLSKKYDRGVGFFSSGWLHAAAKGMLVFAGNEGKARWVTSPILTKEDWQALQLGDTGRHDPIIKAAIIRNINSLAATLERDVLSAIAWMVADEILTFKLAVPRDRLENGEFHDKFGVFSDEEGNYLSFSGSYNDSIKGLRNYESIKIFWSWDQTLFKLAEADRERFESLWNNLDPNVQVFNLDEAAKQNILELRTHERPYRKPDWVEAQLDILENDKFHIPTSLQLREYQRIAIRKWLEAQGRGILSMATGSGKTITALYAAYRLWERAKPMAIVVVCPYIHLAEQWIGEMKKFGLDVIGCFDSRARWQNDMQIRTTSLIAGQVEVLSIAVTNSTFSSKAFRALLKPNSIRYLIIADEVHNLGADGLKLCLDERFEYRLGLSATPERHYDEEGTKQIMDYFGGVVYDFPLKDAIDADILTQYDYFPIIVDLDEEEAQAYWKITSDIARLISSADEEINSRIQTLLIRRARLLAGAKSKFTRLKQLIAESREPVNHTIIYCGDGRVGSGPDAEMVRHVTAVTRILGDDLGLRVKKFTADEPEEQRKEIITDLINEKLNAIVAIRCLDEGVDMPAVRTAYIIASSSNPRQYVQRRGRLLRKAKDKKLAIIYDFIVQPPKFEGDDEDQTFNVERRLFSRELHRIIEFCETARNGIAALNTLSELRQKYNLLGI